MKSKTRLKREKKNKITELIEGCLVKEMPVSDIAYLTHFLQVKDTKAEKYYREKANKIFEKFGVGKEDQNVEWNVPFPPPQKHDFTFMDLFAGIGGFRIAFQELGGKSVFSSDNDKFCQKSYYENYGEYPFGDIKRIDETRIPEHDILNAGFPCQAFSIAGKKAGFEDTRGTLFFDIARILNKKRPKAFFLENVQGLKNHKGGETLRVILRVLREELDYFVPEPQIINAKNFGVPQNRPRIFIVGFRKDLGIDEFDYPVGKKTTRTFSDVREEKPVSSKYYLSDQYLEGLRNHRKNHESKGHGFGFQIINNGEIANSLVVGGMGRERNLVFDHRIEDYTPVTNIKGEVNREDIRRMTPREWARLQGFPDEFKIKVSDTQAYIQFANSVAVSAVKATGKKIISKLKEKGEI